jgi:uncharacterized membrane protein YbhN (UPF0104 family)
MLKTILKIIVSCLILFLLFQEIHWATVAPYFHKITLTMFLFAVLTQLLSSLLGGWRWGMIMSSLSFEASQKFYLKSYLKGVMFNQILPTSIGGDAYRMMETSRLGRGKKEAILGVLVDRVYGSVGLVLLNLIALPFTYAWFPTVIFNFIFGISIVVLLATLLLLALQYLPKKWFPKWLFIFVELSQQLTKSANSWKDFFIKVILAIMTNFLTVFAFFILAKGLHVAGSLVDYLMIIPSVLLLTMVPISLAGWGVREGAMIFLGGLIGILKPEALAISILFGFSLIVSSIPGIYFYLRKNVIASDAKQSRK